MPDQRDATTWVTIELTKTGEILASEGLLEAQLRRDLDLDEGHPVFVPCIVISRGGVNTVFHLMEGYVFVAAGLPDVAYFALENQPYVNQIMSTKQGPYRMRTLHVITDAQVGAMRDRLHEQVASNIKVGAQVKICEGQYRNLDGKVVGVEGDNAHVRVKLRSLDFVASVPRIFLEEQPEEGLD